MNLAYRMRPQSLEEFFGQEHLVGEGKLLRKMLEEQTLSSMIFWGPPGSGKTTLANLIAKAAQADFHHLSAVETGKADLMKIIKEAEEKALVIPSEGTHRLVHPEAEESHTTKSTKVTQRREIPPRATLSRDDKKPTILFIDEIHRWNKAQQDALLPYVESGLITLIGATTENPSFEVISALLSRCRVFVLQSLSREHLGQIIHRALTDKKRGVGEYKKTLTAEAEELLTRLSGGDARILLNALELAVKLKSPQPPLRKGGVSAETGDSLITPELIKEIFQTKSAGLYDKKADEHYNIISAFIKSMRGSDVDASLYYLVRMLENGEDPKFIARRMIIFASEDIGLADRGALIQANEAFEAVNKIGMPEAQLVLAHITIYLASAKKSRSVVNALSKAKQAVYEFPNEPIPLHLRNAPTKLMKDLGYAKDYTWPARNALPEAAASLQAGSHSVAGGSEQKVGPQKDLSFLPEKLKNKKFYEE